MLINLFHFKNTFGKLLNRNFNRNRKNRNWKVVVVKLNLFGTVLLYFLHVTVMKL